MRPIILSVVLAFALVAPSHAQGVGDAPAATPVAVTPEVPAPAQVAPVTSDIATTPSADPPVSTTTTTTTTTTPAPAKDAGGLMSDVVSAVRGGQWRLAIAGMLGLLMLGLAKVRNHPRSPFKGDRGGALLVLVLALAGAFGTALASSAPLGLDLVVGALGAALTAAGGYAVIKRLIWPKASA